LRYISIIATIFEENATGRPGYRMTCLMRVLTKQAFYAGVGVIKPYSYRSNGRKNFFFYNTPGGARAGAVI